VLCAADALNLRCAEPAARRSFSLRAVATGYFFPKNSAPLAPALTCRAGALRQFDHAATARHIYARGENAPCAASPARRPAPHHSQNWSATLVRSNSQRGRNGLYGEPTRRDHRVVRSGRGDSQNGSEHSPSSAGGRDQLCTRRPATCRHARRTNPGQSGGPFRSRRQRIRPGSVCETGYGRCSQCDLRTPSSGSGVNRLATTRLGLSRACCLRVFLPSSQPSMHPVTW
jgi:hypothetical protein